MFKSLFILLLLSLPLSINSNETSDIESRISKEKSSKDKYFLSLSAARHFMAKSSFLEAKKFYEISRDIKISKDKSEVYVNLVSIEISLHNVSGIKDSINNARKYYKENSAYSNKSYTDYLNLVSRIKLNDDSIKDEDFSSLSKGIYSFEIKNIKFEELIKQKKYAMALSQMDSEGVKEAGTQYKILYDLLRTLVLKKNITKSELYCSKKYKKFPNDYSYTRMICKSLHEYLDKSLISNSNIKELEDYFGKRYSEKRYLISALKDLN